MTTLVADILRQQKDYSSLDQRRHHRYRRVVAPFHVVELVDEPPQNIQNVLKKSPKPTPQQSKGFTFQNKVRKAIKAQLGQDSQMLYEQWVKFRDSQGWGCCRPDIVVVEPHRILVLECKLTLSQSAWKQLEELYVPLLAHYWQDRPVQSAQVVKNVLPEACRGLELLSSLQDLWDREPHSQSRTLAQYVL